MTGPGVFVIPDSPATQRLLDLIVEFDREHNEAPEAATAPGAEPQAVGGPDAS